MRDVEEEVDKVDMMTTWSECRVEETCEFSLPCLPLTQTISTHITHESELQGSGHRNMSVMAETGFREKITSANGIAWRLRQY